MSIEKFVKTNPFIKEGVSNFRGASFLEVISIRIIEGKGTKKDPFRLVDYLLDKGTLEVIKIINLK